MRGNSAREDAMVDVRKRPPGGPTIGQPQQAHSKTRPDRRCSSGPGWRRRECAERRSLLSVSRRQNASANECRRRSVEERRSSFALNSLRLCRR
uniref:Uncharacterized protein n=1 Tax=Plectus sambesii TaxID=2011161 RepID=A0A914UVY1_9BILA